jgi:hypothetical protein
MQLVTTLLDVVGVLAVAAGVTAALWSLAGPAAITGGGLVVLGASQLAAGLAARRARGER